CPEANAGAASNPTVGASPAAAARGFHTHPVFAVSVKIPKFTPTNPTWWFRSAEAQFGVHAVSKELTMYRHIVAALDVDQLGKFGRGIDAADAASLLPTGTPYSNFMAYVLKVTKKSYLELFEEVLALTMGDRTPSELVRVMTCLWPDGPAEAETSLLFKACFVRKLPDTVRQFIVNAGEMVSIDDAASLADRQIESMRAREASAPVFAVGAVPTGDSAEDVLNAAFKVLAAHQRQPQDQTRQRPKKKDVPGKKLPTGGYMQANGQVLCRFHAQYGDKAYTCQKPCSAANSINRVAVAHIPVVASLGSTGPWPLEPADNMVLPADFYTCKNSIKIHDATTGTMWMADSGFRLVHGPSDACRHQRLPQPKHQDVCLC
ncbi:hypothetical protein TCAL_04210, partial [Tigriopus californicus]